MTSQFTDDRVKSARLIHRRYVQVPKDQIVLLENAWSETLQRGQYPMLNVPPAVLQDVKDLHTRKRKQAESTQQASSPESRLSNANSAIPCPGSSWQQQPSTPPSKDRESDGTPIPWSLSPQPHTGRAEVEDVLEQEPMEPEVQMTLPTQHKRSSPRQSPIKTQLPPYCINSEPPSSAANSEGLDIEPPGFVSQEMGPPVNRAASRAILTDLRTVEATPPSAQMPIDTAQAAARSPPAKRRRMEEHSIADVERKPGDLVRGVIGPSPKPSSGNLVSSNHNSLTTSISSASLGISIAREGPSRSSEHNIMSNPNQYRYTSSIPPTYEGRPREIAPQDLVITGTSLPEPSFAPPPAQRITAGNRSPRRSTSQALPRSQCAPTTPYEIFKAAYPDYTRCSRDFVTAVLIVNHYKQRRELHEFLYDDFIRAYTSYYFSYVSECSRRATRKVLPGIQWYNKNVQDVLYTKRVVRKTNVEDFLKAHSEEMYLVNRLIEDSEASASQCSDEDSDEATENASDVDDADEQDGQDSDEQMEDALDDGKDGEQKEQKPKVMEHASEKSPTQPSPEYHIESPNRVATPMQSVRQGSSEFHMDSPSAAIATATPDRQNARSQARTSPAPATSFASQENDSDSLQAVPSTVPEASAFLTQVANTSLKFSALIHQSAPSSLEVSRPREEQQAQRAPGISPPPLARVPSSTVIRKSPELEQEEEQDAHEEEAFEPPMHPPQAKAKPSSLRKPSSVSSDDDRGAAFEPPVAPPRQGPRPLSMSQFQKPSMDAEMADPYDLPTLSPPKRAAGSPAKTAPKADSVRGIHKSVIDESSTLKTWPSDAITSRRPASTAPLVSSTVSVAAATAPGTRTISSTMPIAATSETGPNSIKPPMEAAANTSTAPSLSVTAGTHRSRGSSISSARKSRMKQSERSKKLQEFARRRAASSTPASTSASKQ